MPAQRIYEEQISAEPSKRWKVVPPIMEELKTEAKKRGLWNLFLSKVRSPLSFYPVALTIA